MSKRPFVIFGLFAALCLVVLPFLALGKEGDEDAAIVKVESQDEDSKALFANNCGPCHTLAAAGTDGVIGPDLDATIAATGTNDAQQFEGNYARVIRPVSCGIEGRMPKGILVGEDSQEVAAFVAAYAGQIDKGPTVNTATAAKPEPEPC